jgi:hypothetical protein
MRLHHGFVLMCAVPVVAQAMVGVASGQEKARSDANAVEVRFADDSTVKMVLQHAEIEVVTRYGKLTVPVGEMRRIEFGLRIPEETTRRIEAAVARLGSAEFKQRDAASAELLGMRELAYPALQQAARSSDPEVARRAKDALKSLADTVPIERVQLPRHDTVVTADFTIIGQIETPALKARTPYFGETSLKLAEMRTIRFLGNDRETKVAVDAARFGGQQEAWMDTGIDVRVGGALQIAASGTVDLRPVPGEAGQYVTGPDGLRNLGGRQPAFPPGAGGPVAFQGAAGGRGPGRQPGGQQYPGALVGRIGELGRVFVVGSRYEGAATEDGKLYLRIVPSPINAESSGNYEVRVTAGR